MRTTAWVLVAVVVLGATAAASAQRPDSRGTQSAQRPDSSGTQTIEDNARALFVEGNQFLNEGDFAEARNRFRDSLALVRRTSTAFNLGVALRGMGLSTEALALFEGLLSGEYGALTDAQRQEVGALRTQTQSDLASLRVHACGADEISVRINGTVERSAVPCKWLSKQVDAGDYTITAGALRAKTVERRVNLSRGGLAEVRLRVEPQPEESGGLLKSPVFWVVMGAVVVAGVVTAVLLSSSTADAKPTDDPVTGRAVTLVSF